MLEVALDQNEYGAGDTMTVAVTARNAGTAHAQRHRRPAAGDATASMCKPGAVAGEAAGRPRLGHRRLCGRDPAPAARRAGAAHARPRHRRAMVLDRPHGKDAHPRSQAPPLIRPNTTLHVPVKVDGPAGRRRGARGGRRRRCRHSQSHQLQAAVAGRLLSRAAPALRRHPRSLRRADRRHAGRARPDPQRRRRRRGAARQPADQARRWRSIPAS